MSLPRDLISEFVRVTNDKEKTKKETTVYGTIVKDGGLTYVKLDGSDVNTPVSTTADTKHGERVTVLIKNHTATVTGNITSPAARTGDVQELGTDVNNIVEDNLTINGKLTAVNAEISNLKTNKLDAETAEITYATIANLEVTNAAIDSLEATHGEFETRTAQNFEAMDAKIDKLVVGDLDAKYANIDFSNIGKAAMEYFYSTSGLIENVVVSDGAITGNLIGVTIKGDLIEGNTVVADKLVIQGEDGLYYKLNTDGVKIEAEQTDYNSLNGSIITAKSITATKISVDDLVAFDATIGGFNISSDSLYSGVKETVDNTARGIYLDKTGQMAIGDSSDYLKYYKDTDGTYKLDISIGGSDLKTSVEDAGKTATNFLSYDSTNGLQVGNKTGGTWSGFRTQTTSDSFNVLNSDGEANVTITLDGIGVSTTGDVTINASSVKDSNGEFVSVVNGTSGNWTYRKWSDGTVELWGSQEISGVTCTTSFGSSMYRSDALTMITFPFSVYSPNLTASYESDGYGAMLWATSRTTETSPPSYYLLRATSGTISSGKIVFHVFGKWTS